ncbi:MAG: hypothetical protein O3A46_05460 [Candidatus Poribacteria bacterium]|nr:hypothetical protein [Candidatus Poribacteria bacterium]
MIENDEQLQIVGEQLQRMYRAIASLRRDVYPQNPQMFHVMAEGPRDQIRLLQQDIERYTGITQAQEYDADLWMRLEGNGIDAYDAPTSVVGTWFSHLRTGVQAVAAYMTKGVISTPTKWIRQACDFRMVGVQQGSLRLGLKLPAEEQLESLPDWDPSLVRTALKRFLDGFKWAASDEDHVVLEALISDPDERRVVLTKVRDLVPNSRSDVETVELSGKLIGDSEPIRLTHQAIDRIDKAIKNSIDQTPKVYTGIVADLRRQSKSFTLRDVDGVAIIRCRFDESVEDVIGTAENKSVKLRGTLLIEPGNMSQTLEVLDLLG